MQLIAACWIVLDKEILILVHAWRLMILWTRFILVNSKYELICFSECKSMQDSLERLCEEELDIVLFMQHDNWGACLKENLVHAILPLSTNRFLNRIWLPSKQKPECQLVLWWISETTYVRVRCFGTIFYKTTNEILDHFSVISMIPTVSHLPSLRYLVHGVKLQIQNVAPTDRSCWRFTKIVFFSSYFFSINLNVSTYHTYNSMKLNASTAEKTAQQNSEYQTIITVSTDILMDGN